MKTTGETTTTPSISVVIPAYQIAPYIAETLDSVFAQTLTDFEIIIVNDGSPDTDELERALAPYGERICYIRQENAGAGAARNRGVRGARGEFVAFLDGDDLWHSDYLEKQLKFVREGDYDLVYADALLFGDSPIAGKTYMQTAPSEGPVTFISLLRNDCNVITSGVVARRSAVIDAGLFDETLRNAQDFEMWTRMAKRGARLAYQRKVLLRYRCREGSLSGDEMNRLKREIRVYRHIKDTYDLTPAEQAELSRAMELQEAAVALADGKIRLLGERFDEARVSFEQAHRVMGGWKLGATVVMLRVAPRLLRRLARQRLGPQF
ncbi:MAG TPA: glycosyltransferase family A protein [Pyrinomonadaceae bacterium]|nr:glycosyltransferase family A protein [Pyrinomonadaceae bacterium]